MHRHMNKKPGERGSAGRSAGRREAARGGKLLGSRGGTFSTERSPVAVLLILRRPAAIRWLVIAVIVDTVQRMLWRRALAHVGEKILEGIAPTGANRNSARPVILPTGVILVCAALNHSGPSAVFPSAALAVFAVFDVQHLRGPLLCRVYVRAQSVARYNAPCCGLNSQNPLRRTAFPAGDCLLRHTQPAGKSGRTANNLDGVL